MIQGVAVDMLLKGDPASFEAFVAQDLSVRLLHRFGEPLAQERRQLGGQRTLGAQVQLRDGGCFRGPPAGENGLHAAPPEVAKLLVVVLESYRVHVTRARENLRRGPQRQVVAPGFKPVGEPGGRLRFQLVERGQGGLLHGLLDIPVAPAAESLGGRSEQIAGFVGGEMHQHVGAGLSPFAVGQNLPDDRSTGEKQPACDGSELGHCRQPDRAYGKLFYCGVHAVFQLRRSNGRRQGMGVDPIFGFSGQLTRFLGRGRGIRSVLERISGSGVAGKSFRSRAQAVQARRRPGTRSK